SRRTWPPTMQVFYDIYVMPQYVRAVGIYLLVLRAFYPDEQVRANHNDTLAGHARRLQEVHDISAAGIHHMNLPVADGTETMMTDDGDTEQAWGFWSLGQPVSAYWDDAVEYYQPIGVVHCYSGYSAFTKFPPWPDGSPIDKYTPGYFAKAAIATRVRWKDAYIALKLPDVGTAANQIWTFLGETGSLRTGDPGRWWGLREIYSMLTYPFWDGVGWPTTWWMPGGLPAGLSDGSYNDHKEISAKDVLRRFYLLSGLDPDPAFP